MVNSILKNPDRLIRVDVDLGGKVYAEALHLLAGKSAIWAEFKNMTVGDYWHIDSESSTTYTDEKSKHSERFNDNSVCNKLILKRQLANWNVNIKLEFDHTGCLKDGCLREIMTTVPAPIISGLVDKYKETYVMSDEEEETLSKQVAVLFGKNTRGVSGACEGVVLYCTLNSFWEKFGLNRFDIIRLGYKEYVILKEIMSAENERRRAELKSIEKKSHTKVVRPGRI